MAERTRKTTTKKTTKSTTASRPKTATGAKGTTATRSAAKATVITEDQVRERAFQIYQTRNGGGGDAMADWTQAERELRGNLSK